MPATRSSSSSSSSSSTSSSTSSSISKPKRGRPTFASKLSSLEKKTLALELEVSLLKSLVGFLSSSSSKEEKGISLSFLLFYFPLLLFTFFYFLLLFFTFFYSNIYRINDLQQKSTFFQPMRKENQNLKHKKSVFQYAL